MPEKLKTYYKTTKKYIRPIFYRNTVTLPNIIFVTVTILLLVFGEIQEGLFLFVIVVLNSIIGTIQDLRAKIALEELQILMTPQVKRMLEDGGTEKIPLERVHVGDRILLELGDQIPTDGNVEASNSVEVNEALLTGESSNIGKKVGDQLLAGSFVVAGSAVLEVQKLPKESYVAGMTSKLKEYRLELSPIQRTLTLFIQYMSYVLLVAIVYVLISGISGHELVVTIVRDIAALTGTLVPQGLILATTIFFAYGAVRLFRKQVLLQEINATEKLGRIKNLCVDKTGTLTENVPVLEQIITRNKDDESAALSLAIGYFAATSDASHTAHAITQKSTAGFVGKVLSSIPFSSSRKYGSATLNINEHTYTVVMGAPDILLPYIENSEDASWVKDLIATHAPKAKRLVLLTKNPAPIEENLDHSALAPVALFVLTNPLRAGTKDIINFFQEHGVRVRVISGDNPETVRAIAEEAGILYTDLVITGQEMLSWDNEMYKERVPAYHIFARIRPEQKEKIIEVLKLNGFTAMVGDGANDALALKKADLGIAMFEGSQATRSIAQIVLMNNSFGALPAGVELADSIITNIELVASVFFNKVAVGLLLFIILAFLGHDYPISPRNTTVIGYFTIALPIFYWAMWPVRNPERALNRPFLRKILPYSLIQSAITTAATTAVFFVSPHSLQRAPSNVLIVLTLIALGISFFALAPLAYAASSNILQRKNLYTIAGGSIFTLLILFSSKGLRHIFGLGIPPLLPLVFTAGIVAVTIYIQYKITLRWFGDPRKK